MGGKTKQTQRTKNNARPSNSGRSAELLGSTVPVFVGFGAHSDLGMVPFAPGFSTMDSLPDTFDSSISAQYQLVMRKMCKKDPVTKVKALQEFQTLVSESDAETIKSILPLWPRFYHNLANDVEHRVRETAQQAQSSIATKAGKSIAPFIKQIAPVWIASQFDNYAPAASIATTSFKASFSENKVQEVLNHCQTEILDYITRNLTFHTASTLNSTKSCSAEDAENKYQRVVIGSLKTFALFVEKTYASKKNDDLYEKYQQILQNQKFWSFSKHKTTNIRAAWYELMYIILQHAPAILETNRTQIMQMCFQNMDEVDPLVSPHIWGCILVIQTVYIDWHDVVNFKKTIQPKFNSLFKNVYNGNATIFGPMLLPFVAKLNEIILNDLDLYEFYNQLFENIKKSINATPTIHNVSKSDIAGLTLSFYECLRFIFKNINSEIEQNKLIHEVVANEFFDKYIIDIIKWSFQNDHIITKYIFRHCAALIAYWSNNIESKFYANIFKKFWLEFSNILMENLSSKLCTEMNTNQIIEFIQMLRNATPSLTDNKVKFAERNNKCSNVERNKISSENVLKELKSLVIQLVRIYFEKPTEYQKKHVLHLKILCEMFNDKEFYRNLSKENDLMSTLNLFKIFIQDKINPPEEFIDIIFEIISLLEKNKQFEQIRLLLQIRNDIVQKCILQRMLSYPLCIEPEIRSILSEKNVVNIILNIARDVIKEDSKEKFNLLHKCFFQIDSGKILINPEAVNGIIDIMSEPLTNQNGMETMIDTCGSFIAQIMPVISDNVSQDQQNNIFLKLFQFSVDMVVNDNLSEDTLWEITTCWQDALSSEDITMDDDLILKCFNIVKNRIDTTTDDLSILEINNIADTVAKLIICSTETIDCIEDRYKMIDKYLLILLESKRYEKLENQLKNLCCYFENLNKIITTTEMDNDFTHDIPVMDLKKFFRFEYFKFSTIFRLICNIKDKKKIVMIKECNSEDDQEYTEDYCDPEENLLKSWSDDVYNIVMHSIKYAEIGESLLQTSNMFTDETIILSLCEKIILMLNNSNENFINSLKSRLCEFATNGDITWIRTLPFLLYVQPYKSFEENRIILYFEDISELFLEKNNYLGYLNFIQLIKSKLSRKAVHKSKEILQINEDYLLKSGYYTCLLSNHLDGEVNEIEDYKLISECISYLNEIGEQQQADNTKFLYNEDLTKCKFRDVSAVAEYMNLLTNCIQRFPTELSIKNWDSIRIGLCSWVLSVSKSIENFADPKVAIFASACYHLFAALSKFIRIEKTKSSTKMLSNVIDEWENLFSREVNLVLFKSYYNLVLMEAQSFSTCYNAILDAISPTIGFIDFKILFNACQSGFKISLNDLIKFVLDNLSNENGVRKTCLLAIKTLSQDFIKLDKEILDKRNETVHKNNDYDDDNWHFLNQFTSHIQKYGLKIAEYIPEFSYKMTELSELKSINQKDALTYFHLWDCIIDICSKSPAELRSVYATWISDNKYEQTLLNFLFRAMPIEILKNHDTKALNNDMYKVINWMKILDDNISVERWACYLYSQMLRHLPAVVRKWWSSANARQKLFVDKLTTNYVSNLIWQEDLQAINRTKDKHENMQITVHTSTREVIAIYSIDEARMELIITLAQNHPLGAVKVESGKQIGGRAQSRNVGMQLTIFLTHQNGSIFDGLSLWKKNLDKKFSGVEECYICYTVIHQDTCQLPKLTCKTCKKRFHGPCLYKWFTTSSKSTCPLCRNIF